MDVLLTEATWSRVFGSLATAVVVAGTVMASGPAIADDEVSVDREVVEEIIISEPFFAAPEVVSPGSGETPMVVVGPEGELFWVLEVTNSDYQAGVVAEEGYVGFETLPSVGVFDTVTDRLAWTNQTFACFVGTSCEEPQRTADQVAFGDDFVKLPKLYDEATGRVAYHAEHAYNIAKDPYEWVVGQQTLSIAIPLAQTPSGVIEVWVGYTYIYTDDLVGVAVRFTEEAMAITTATIAIPSATDTGDLVTTGDASGAQGQGNGDGDSDGVPLWVVQGLLGIVGVLMIFGIVVLIVQRAVIISRRRDSDDSA